MEWKQNSVLSWLEFCFEWSGNRIPFWVEWKQNFVSSGVETEFCFVVSETESFGVLETESFVLLEMESFGVLERIVSVSRKLNSISVWLGNGCFISWCFFVRTYSRTTVEAKTRSLSKRSRVETEMRSLSERSCYIIISPCCSLKNDRMLIVL